MGNPALNSVILATLGLGILYVIRQILRLTPERNCCQSENWFPDTPEKRPVLLATVYAMLMIPVTTRNYRHCHCVQSWMVLPPDSMRA